jgi:uncharacterized membrane protein (UPF0127 family)
MKKFILISLSIILFYYLFFKENNKIELITNEKPHSDEGVENTYNFEETSNYSLEYNSSRDKKIHLLIMITM